MVAFHHIPCLECFYCRRKLYAQCPVYKKVGITAGFEPAGGGFSQYVRVMDWIVERGVEKIPDGVSFERATLGGAGEHLPEGRGAVRSAARGRGGHPGPGPIGLMFTMLVQRTGARDGRHRHHRRAPRARRALRRRVRLGSARPSTSPPRSSELTGGRGADLVIVAASVPGIVEQAIALLAAGRRILLFAQTSATERIEASGADICVGERTLFGCYSASVDLQKESARSGIQRRTAGGGADFPPFAAWLKSVQDIDLALHPGPKSLKIIVQPQRWS